MIDAANYIITKGSTALGVFYNKIGTANFGTVGHSQGGASITNLHARKNPIFKT